MIKVIKYNYAERYIREYKKEVIWSIEIWREDRESEIDWFSWTQNLKSPKFDSWVNNIKANLYWSLSVVKTVFLLKIMYVAKTLNTIIASLSITLMWIILITVASKTLLCYFFICAKYNVVPTKRDYLYVIICICSTSTYTRIRD